jgi:hypothetical protein
MNSTVKSEFSHFKQFSIDLHENEPICQMKSEPQVSIHRQRSCIINKELSFNREGIPPSERFNYLEGSPDLSVSICQKASFFMTTSKVAPLMKSVNR